MSIIDLQEISPDYWKAKYRGNYGTYTIKVKTEDSKTTEFSCSCPSSYYPCKHIPMIEEAIKLRIAQSRKSDNNQDSQIEQLLRCIPQKELGDFILRQALHNPQLKNAILLEFAHKETKKDFEAVDKYKHLLQEALEGVYFDYDDLNYDYESLEIDVLDQWLDKAQHHADNGNPHEALLICKACIEEFAAWYEDSDSDVLEYIDSSYQERPFAILSEIIFMPEIEDKKLFDYCKSEMLKPKYKGTEMYNGFNELLMKLSAKVGSGYFIALQDNLLKEISDKSSWEAKEILQRKIDFYQTNGQPEKEWDIIRDNLQIESFRKKWVVKLIEDNQLKEAKKIISDFILQKGDSVSSSWDELKLQIAQTENDVPEICHISYRFIESGFSASYYAIYKSTFTKEEWPEKMEKLIQLYEKRNPKWFHPSVAKIFQIEKLEERLMKYVEKHLTIENLENYYTDFAPSFSEKTLAMFRKVIDRYAQHTGRGYYEHIAELFGKMVQIEGGNAIVKEMISQYRVLYKGRRAMMEIFDRFMGSMAK